MARYRFLLGGLLLLTFFSLAVAQNDDQPICNKIFSYAFEHKLIERPIGDVIAEIGKQFLGKPYKSNTLDQQPDERLVTNLHSFDCVTFVENVLALSLCVKSNQLSFDAYRKELQAIRYRNGAINGYTSRLHYFSDWILDNQKKGIVEDITEKLGGKPYKKMINFMSSHRALYPKLAADSTFATLTTVEDSLNRRKTYFIPKSTIPKSAIRNGDIIAITTSRKGLDISHVGIAVRVRDGSLHYMHAPNVKGVVKITEETLVEHLKKHSEQSGIMVLRAVEFEALTK